MKKVLVFLACFMSILIFSGCDLNNTPTKKVEAYLNNYRNLDAAVVNQLDETVNVDTIMDVTQKNNYKDILKKQYKDLTYTIKDETIDGNTAKVKVEIEVYDYYKLTNEADKYYATTPDEFKDENGNIVETKYIDYKINKMKDYKERVKYTIDFTLTKTDRTWVLDNITEETRQKIHGLYAY